MRLGTMPLAHKCLLCFGAAVVLIVFGAMVGPWLRMVALIDAGERELSRELVRVWEREGNAERLRAAEMEGLAGGGESGPASGPSNGSAGGLSSGLAPVGSDVAALRSAAEGPSGNGLSVTPRLDGEVAPLAMPRPEADPDAPPASRVRAGVGARRLSITQAEALAREDAFVREALERFRAEPNLEDVHDGRWSGTTREYRYAKAQRAAGRAGTVLMSIVVLDRRSLPAAKLLLINSAHLIGTGVVVLVAAMGVFYFITRALVLRPVKELEDAAERVRQGNFAVRAQIATGDEFQHLAETLNLTLSDLQASQDRLRAINAAMDIKLHELSEANSTLFQTAKMKGEFLASVSHELRTPLNSIIGFAELLQETARGEVVEGEPPAPTVSRRLRYLDNIITAGKNLLSMINSLLEMARIEAGKVEIRPERVGLRDACEGLLGLIAPLAQKKGITLNLEASEDLPPIRTDAKKLQQIVFNFLSNAVKFTESKERTGREPQITLRAERLVWSTPGSEAEERVRISVIDNGPGISAEEKERIFEKFYQVHGGHTREHAGTGLGLAIVRDLANLLGAQIQVESEVGRGSMFSVILPLSIPEGTKEARVVAEAVGVGVAAGEKS